MKFTFPKLLVLLTLLALITFAAGLHAADKVTLTGSAMCAKCVLHEAGADKCQTVLEVTGADGKVEKYYFTSKMDHKQFCGKKVDNVTVTGTVTEKDGKKYITPEKVTTS